ncbi:MAG: hypothetical protein NC489_08840 [Ruminococcus flavefaciens]|nr:hypothetical protein [Ruminococcus flavefaciens]
MAKNKAKEKVSEFTELIPIAGGPYDRWLRERQATRLPKDSDDFLTTLVDIYGSEDIVNMSEVPIGDYCYNKGLLFSMNMNVGRSIPWIEDGLKSVERRVLYIAFKKGLLGNKSTKVSSLVGSMIELVYPHGDQAAADTIYRLGRSKTMMIPYIQEKGNYGNMSDLKPAAPRYAEAALTDYAADCFFGDIGPKRPLYDEKDSYEYTGTEPIYLISRYPNILMQWNQGIGKGASSWLGAFNSTDIFKAALALMDDPKAKIDIYPDTPIPLNIVNAKSLKGCFDRKKFKVAMRAPYRVEVDQRRGSGGKIEDKYVLVFTAVPLGVYGKQIAEEIKTIKLEDKNKSAKRLPEVLNVEIIADEDLPGGIEIIIEYERGYDPHVLAEKLYKATSLAKVIGVKYSLIFNYMPDYATPREILLKWINQRYDQKRRYYHQVVLKAAKDRAKYEALVMILESTAATDKAIAIIRKSKNNEESIKGLRKEFGMTVFQARCILQIPLATLQKLDIEEQKVKKKEAIDTYKTYRKLLSEDGAVKEAVREELKEGLKKYGRKRNAILTNLEGGQLDPDAKKYILYNQDTFYCVDDPSKIPDFWDKINNSYKMVEVKNNDTVMIFTREGMVKMLVGSAFSMTSSGISMNQLGVKNVVSIIGSSLKSGYNALAMITEQGYGKVVDLASILKVDRGGRVMNLYSPDTLVDVIPIKGNGHTDSIIGMVQGDTMYYLKAEDFPRYQRASAGNRMVKNVEGLQISRLVYFDATDNADYMLIYGESGYLKFLDAAYLAFSKRGNNTISLQGKKIIGAIFLHGSEDNLALYNGSGKLELKVQIGKVVKFVASTGEEQKFKMATSIGTPTKVLKLGKNDWYCME